MKLQFVKKSHTHWYNGSLGVGCTIAQFANNIPKIIAKIRTLL